jgi:hypothetical protein
MTKLSNMLCLIFAVVSWSGNAPAQTTLDGVYLTKPVHSALTAHIASAIMTSAPRVGFNEKDTMTLVTGALDGSLKIKDYAGQGPVVSTVVAETSAGNVQFRNAVQLDAIQRVASLSSQSAFLENFATVKLDVKPVPPRDYKVVINGEDCEATERALYRVPAGDTAVLVNRTGKPNCSWSGQNSRWG